VHSHNTVASQNNSVWRTCSRSLHSKYLRRGFNPYY